MGQGQRAAAGTRELAGGRCQIWGVLNVTHDSFSDGGRYLTKDAAIAHALGMLEDGADVIDVGGASSRPAGVTYGQGAAPVSPQEESERVVPVVRWLAAQGVAARGARISVDTTSAEVAERALAAGADIVNDVSGARHPELLRVAAAHGCDYVLMHTRGDGEVRSPNTDYDDVVGDVARELLAGVAQAEACGIAREHIWLDPGIGFAKTAEQSLTLLGCLGELLASGFRVLVGPSRKAFIAQAAPRADGSAPPSDNRLAGTAAAVTVAARAGAHAVRVHDVAAMRQAVLVALALDGRAGASR